MSLNDIFKLAVAKGEIACMLLNTYSSIIIKTNLLTTLFDPVGIEQSKCKDIDVDVIVVTHEHVDHFNEELVRKLQRQNNAFVLATPFIASRLRASTSLNTEAEDKEKEMIKGMKVGDSFGINDTIFFAEYSAHPAIQPLSFVIKTESATIYHPDDSKAFAGMTAMRNRYMPDLMLYTGTSVGNMVEIAEKIGPKMVISYADPRFEDIKIKQRIPHTATKTIKQLQVFLYKNK
jgi:L-ascorbate metabolism protein UlaG (beta-lactamase superfamily)